MLNVHEKLISTKQNAITDYKWPQSEYGSECRLKETCIVGTVLSCKLRNNFFAGRFREHVQDDNASAGAPIANLSYGIHVVRLR